MAGETLKPEAVELFRKYRASDRAVFLDEILTFIWGANHTGEEHSAILKAAVERGKSLRRPTGAKRGRPRGSGKQSPQDGPECDAIQSRPTEHSDSGADVAEEFARDWKQHRWFRTVCMTLGDFPAKRPLFLTEILTFIRDARRDELAKIRKAVAEQRKTKTRQRGRPGVRKDERIMTTALRVAWMRHVEGRTWQQITHAFPQYGHDEKFKTLRNLEGYLAAAIWRTIPSNYTRQSAKGREIAPGALDSRPLQRWIRWHTGLPFDSHPEESKRIVQALWPHGFAVVSKLEKRLAKPKANLPSNSR